jgi:hypothetical protein
MALFAFFLPDIWIAIPRAFPSRMVSRGSQPFQ